jgi:hypothetical protein
MGIRTVRIRESCTLRVLVWTAAATKVNDDRVSC